MPPRDEPMCGFFGEKCPDQEEEGLLETTEKYKNNVKSKIMNTKNTENKRTCTICKLTN